MPTTRGMIMNKQVTRVSVLAAAAATTLAGLGVSVAVPAPADAARGRQVVLPPQNSTFRMGDGTVLTLQRTKERARVVRSMGGTQVHRAAWVSGKYTLRVSRKIVQIQVQPAYQVGCQVNFNSFTGTAGGTESDLLNSGGGGKSAGIDNMNAGGTAHLGPGRVAQFNINESEYADDFGAEKHDPFPTFKNTQVARFSYVNAQLGLTGCGGYAQARSMARVMVETDFAMQTVTFYGRPFSIG
ncbi:MspA family porin [Gordonia sp. (in: high G+C Gram-positive bacteria)]|uniref:MspA family porin n=1 Tax=Gordonia sp. (in: high G+C Gram-positive bacteria) TaxID=84139 RepID=UPI0039E619E4